MLAHHDHPHADGLPSNRGALYEELVHHLPFSVSAIAVGLTVAGIICYLAQAGQRAGAVPEPAAHVESHEHGAAPDAEAAHEHDHDHGHANPFQDLFHLFHPVHMLFSAAATTAMFWRYERRVLKAVIIGMIGAIGVCGLSDIVIPQLSIGILGKAMPWHMCVLEHPGMVLSFAAVGVLLGLVAPSNVRSSTFFSHSLHVFYSTMASIFYLIGPFGPLGWIPALGTVFPFLIVAVIVPCCASDIVFPLALTRSAQSQFQKEHVCCGSEGVHQPQHSTVA